MAEERDGREVEVVMLEPPRPREDLYKRKKVSASSKAKRQVATHVGRAKAIRCERHLHGLATLHELLETLATL